VAEPEKWAVASRSRALEQQRRTVREQKGACCASRRTEADGRSFSLSGMIFVQVANNNLIDYKLKLK